MKNKSNQKSQGIHILESSAKNINKRILIIAGLLLTALAAYIFWPSAEITSTENKHKFLYSCCIFNSAC